MSNIEKPRVRIAPSPTGPLHIGTARTALFNYLFVKKYGGSFVLRIEDTDLERSHPKWEDEIIESLRWLGIVWDEGPLADGRKEGKRCKGDYGPYRQSERLKIYSQYLKKLLEDGRIYHCFCAEEELEAMRQDQMSRGEAPKYVGSCRQLSENEVKKYIAEGKPSILRFTIPSQKIKFNDLIRGEIEFDAGLIGDIVIAKDANTPLYNFAVVVDDFEMKISHVIRGEDHISNTPKQIALQEALGFPRPQYAHLPLILGPDRSKMSKRHGPVSISDYRVDGYLPEALMNFMAFLGWNPGTEKEIYSLEELARDFSLEKIQKAGAVFNISRLDYLNGFYIRNMALEKLVALCVSYLPTRGADAEYVKKVVGAYQERLKKLSEITELTDFFFNKTGFGAGKDNDVLEYDKELLRWKDMTDNDIAYSLGNLENILMGVEQKDFTKQNLEKIIMPIAEGGGDRGKFLWPLRVALTGKKASAGPFEVAEILGKERALRRINTAKKLF